MPIPQPHGGESEEDFVSRCMANEAMRADYEQEQRAAVCYRTYRDSKKASLMDTPKRLYGAIEKVEELNDGTLKVHGVASTEAEDDQGEIIRATAMREAIPDYMKYPAVREMHGLSAAGTALECDCGADNITRIVAHVVDPVAVMKVKSKVYRGFSIGGRIVERDTEKPATINRIKLNEISLVDRPANPEAMINLWKIGDSEMPDGGGLGTLGDVLQEAIAKQAPVQIWACNDLAHRHTKKEEAQRCMATPVAKTAVEEALARGEEALKATPPQRDSRVDQNTDGDKDEDDGYPGGGKKDDDVDDDSGKAAVDKDVEKARRSHTDQGLLNLAYASAMAGANSPGINRMSRKSFSKAAKNFAKAGARAEPGDYTRANPDTRPAEYDDNNPERPAEPTSAGGNDNATQHTQGNAEIAAMQPPVPTETFTAGDNATQDTSKAAIDLLLAALGKRGGHDHFANVAHDCAEKMTAGAVCGDMDKAGAKYSAATMLHLRKAHDHLMRAGAACKNLTMKAAGAEEVDVTKDEFEKVLAEKDTAIAAREAQNSELTKAVGSLTSMVEKLSARVEDIAKQPLPPLTARVMPADVREVSKTEDGRSADHQGALPPQGPTPTEILEALKTMSPEERTLLSIRASHNRPYVQQR